MAGVCFSSKGWTVSAEASGGIVTVATTFTEPAEIATWTWSVLTLAAFAKLAWTVAMKLFLNPFQTIKVS